MKLNTRQHLSLACLTTDPIDRDWSEGYAETWETILPEPTLNDVREWAPDLIDGQKRPRMTDKLREAFEQSDGRDEWCHSFEPMMNYAWPVSLCDVNAEDAAALIKRHAPDCALIELLTSDDCDRGNAYAIALTGGGMDLSDNLAAAYICCGCVPPLRILGGLANVMGEPQARRIGLRRAYRQARNWLQWQARDLLAEERKVYAKATKYGH